MKPICIFYHIYAVNNWKSLVTEQLEKLRSCGLYDACLAIFVDVIGDEQAIQQYYELIRSYQKIYTVRADNRNTYEYDGLVALKTFANEQRVFLQDVYLLYFHTKGVTSGMSDWRRYMEHFVIENWRNCVYALDDYDTVGVNYHNDIDSKRFHYSGNFWWTKASYVNTLGPVVNHEEEFWIATGNPKAKTLHNSNINHYHEPYPRERYVSANIPTVLMDDLVVGTFTHRLSKVPLLLESLKKHYPNVLFILQYDDKGIAENMEALRQKFIQSGKRYWLFLDDDVQFANSTLIPKALETLVAGNYGGVCCRECISPKWLERPYDTSNLKVVDMHWMIGYFMLVDSKKVGHIPCDRKTPEGGSMDIHYSLDIKMQGYKLALTTDYLYHQAKPQFRNKSVLSNLMQNLGQYFVKHFPPHFYMAHANQFDTRLWDYDIEKRANAIYGWLYPDELAWLAWNATWRFSILDIGTFYGKSAMMLSNTAGVVYTVDVADGISRDGLEMPSQDEHRRIIETNLSEEIKSGKIVPLYGDSIEMTTYFKECGITFDMVWIDGSHNYEQVAAEIRTYRPMMQEYGVICGHDYNYAPVAQAVKDTLGDCNVLGNIWYVNI
jgi:predicted O-methyltransferase YrrM